MRLLNVSIQLNTLPPFFYSNFSNLNLQPSLSVKLLMEEFTQAWKKPTQSFSFNFDYKLNNDFSFKREFNLKAFKSLLKKHVELFKKPDSLKNYFGFIEKYDLETSQNPTIFVRADLHGDLKSLVENLKALQNEALLDENYQCKPGLHLVFLGDYCDRGLNGTEILELLMLLKQENPHQIHLMRGNHEDSSINEIYGATDKNLTKVIKNSKAKKALENFYDTMPLCIYFSINAAKREYIQFTHGLFEISFDPSELLDKKESGEYVLVPKKRQLSERVKVIAKTETHPLYDSAKRINEIFKNTALPHADNNLTAYNWADVHYSHRPSLFGNLGARCYKLNAADINHYLRISSDLHQVGLIFRGHQHQFHQLMFKDKILVSTLPVGIDCRAYQLNDCDKAYILKPSEKLSDWQKRLVMRKRDGELCEVGAPQSILLSDNEA